VEAASGISVGQVSDLEQPASRAGTVRLREMVRRRREGEPLQYAMGEWSFRRLDLMVDPRVLIPRPETEVVVDVALEELSRLRAADATSRPLLVADLGTGSGAIALALAAEAEGAGLGEVLVWATDLSAEALQVASANLAGVGGAGATRVRLAQGDWWEALPSQLQGRLDAVVSNPPYVAEDDAVEAQVRDWEPAPALWSGSDGLDATRVILDQAPSWLRRPGTVVLEMAAARAGPSLDLARRAGFDVLPRQDLAGRPRVLVGRLDPHGM
jgi:release factor glutamine methyltransferase